MRGKRVSDAKKAEILKLMDDGKSAPELAKKYGVAENTMYRWRAQAQKERSVRKSEAIVAADPQRPSAWAKVQDLEVRLAESKCVINYLMRELQVVREEMLSR